MMGNELGLCAGTFLKWDKEGFVETKNRKGNVEGQIFSPTL